MIFISVLNLILPKETWIYTLTLELYVYHIVVFRSSNTGSDSSSDSDEISTNNASMYTFISISALNEITIFKIDNGLTSVHLRALANLAQQRERISIPENAQPGQRRRRHGVLLTIPVLPSSRVVEVG